MSVNQAERAFLAWPILTSHAKKGKTITYKELGSSIGIHHRVVRYVLGLIQNYCLEEKLPPLTILIVNQAGVPGTGFIAWDVDDYDEGFNKVTEYNWSQVENPFTYASNGAQYNEIINSLINDPDNSKDVYKKVKTRGIAQAMFRDALLKTYNKSCAFTNLSFTPGLQACHIVPWAKSTDEERLDVRNGILLNSFHHGLFDQGLITITKKHEIFFFDPEMNEGKYSEYDKLLTVDLHLEKINLPKNKDIWPSKKYISKHHSLNDWEDYLP